MATAAIFDVIDALVALFTANVPTGVVVFDGPDVASSAALEQVTVGSDDSIPGDMRTGREDQEWASIGGVSKNARGSVLCTLHAQSGSADVKTVRDRAKAILTACENALRGDIDLTAGSILYTGLESLDLRQTTTTDGVVVRIVFSVSYRARI